MNSSEKDFGVFVSGDLTHASLSQFHDAEDAKKALEQLNGFELAGRPMKVGHVTERTLDSAGGSALDSDEMDRAGIDLGATGRLQLMAKLAEGTLCRRGTSSGKVKSANAQCDI